MPCWTRRHYRHIHLSRTLKAAVATAGALLALARPARPQEPVFDAKGFSPNREFASDLAFEHIDPLTGNLLLTFTDLVLPGNAGFDLRVQRTYNIKVYSTYVSSDGGTSGDATLGDQGPAGLGWTMHFGRVDILTAPAGPVIEMPDGSSHPSFLHMNTGVPGAYITRDLWTLVLRGSPCNIDQPNPTDLCPLLRLPNGIRYVFGHGNRLTGPFHATDILDAFANRTRLVYEDDLATGRTYVTSAEQRLATGERRTVTFVYEAPLSGGAQVKRLKELRFGGRTWQYGYQAAGGRTLLRSVNPPEGDPDWRFDYFGDVWPSPYLLQRVTTPHGGTLTYTYQAQRFFHRAHSFSPALKTRTAAGTDITPGTWFYRFSQGQEPYWNQPVVATVKEGSETNPSRTITYETWAIGTAEDERPWRIGALRMKRVEGGGASQTETFDWIASMPISPTPESGDPGFTHAPLLERRTIARDGATYRTTHAYARQPYRSDRNRNFDDYGHPHTTTESGGPGQLTRETTRVFFAPSSTDLSLGNYIAGNVKEETVTENNVSARRVFDFLADGFRWRQAVYGTFTSFTKDAGGNVKSRIDGASTAPSDTNKPTEFTWQRGVLQSIKTPLYLTTRDQLYLITRAVADDSTIQSETRRGYTTRFAYDGLFRPTLLDPPENPPGGDATTWTYSPDGRTATQRRAGSSITHTLDGFGRVSATADAESVKTDTDYDAAGRVVYQSFPYTGTSNIGKSFQYDGLDRLKVETNPDGTSMRYSYAGGSAGATVTITDEKDRITRQLWKGFSDPADRRLMSVTDAKDQTTSYSYNVLGRLTRVHPAHGGDRVWTYESAAAPNVVTDRLKEETHPESGTTRYSYYPNGLLYTRTDAESRRTEFRYDFNKRLTRIMPRSYPEIKIGYDASDNRTSLWHGTITSTLGPYDGNNRLKRRVDTIEGQPFTTKFEYDARDNLRQITYPSSAVVAYDHDLANRVTSVTDEGTRVYADGFVYHASGGVERYRSGNGVVNRVCYHPSRYWVTGTSSGTLTLPTCADGGAFLQLGYGHDGVGNVTSTTHVRRPGIYNYTYTYGYDDLYRLTSATTTPTQAWGDLTFDYDAIGNRKFKTRTVPTSERTDYTYHPASNRLTEARTGAATVTFQHDDNGNMVWDGLGTYVYNAENMMAKATANGQTTTYGYDGDNLRKLKKGPATSTYYVHGFGNQLLSEMERVGSGPVTLKRDYIYAGSRLIATLRPPTLTVTPAVLIFAGVAGGPSPAAQAITVAEASEGSLAWQATESTPWLTISPASGTATPSTVAVAVNTTGLAVGTYLGTIRIDAAGAAGSPRLVTVRLVVTNEPGLVVQPGSLDFVMAAGQENPEPQALYAVVSDGPALPWSATPSHSWITVSPLNGTTPSTLAVTVDGSDKPSGTHRGWIKVDGGTTPGSPRYVPVTLVVQPGAGAACVEPNWFCETFDEKLDGDLGGQGYWEDGEFNAQVVSDPRGPGRAALLDPPPNEFKAADFAPFFGDPPVEGSEISVQVMTEGVDEASKQVGKIEFFTVEGQAWGKTTRTFAALRFGASLNLQYGPNIYQVLVDRMEPGRWYDVRVAFENRNIYAYVDGTLLFLAPNPLAAGLPVQAFAMTGWDYPGVAYVDAIDGHGSPGGLVVDPLTLGFRAGSFGPEGGLRAQKAPDAAPTPRALARAIGKLPLSFEANQGQADSAVRFLARAGGYDVFLTPRAAVLSTSTRSEGGAPKSAAITMTFPGARPDAGLVPMGELPGKSHYYIGNDPSRWRTNVPHYARVRYQGIHPGVDVVFYGNSRQLEYDLVLAPGVDPATVKVAFEGADELRLEDGHLVLRTAAGELRQLKPTVYQEVGGARQMVDAEYVLKGREVGFRVADYDRSRPLVVDPVLVYSTYLGGGDQDTEYDFAGGIAVDEDQSVYVVGSTSSPNFPVVNPWQGTMNGPQDAFISKFSADGSRLLFSTYLGGGGGESAGPIVIDTRGHAYIGGRTSSTDFPRVSPIQAAYGGGAWDGFLAKLGESGELLFSSQLGGAREDDVAGIGLDGHGAVYVIGGTQSSSFLWTPSTTHKVNEAVPLGRAEDVFVARVIGAMGYPTYLTFLNGDISDVPGGLAVDGEGSAYVTGTTYSHPTVGDRQRNPFPASLGAFQENPAPDAVAGGDAFVTKLDSTGLVVNYSTYLSGRHQDFGGKIALDPGCDSECSAYVTGGTGSVDFPTTLGAWSRTIEANDGEQQDAFLTKVAPNGASLTYSTFLAGRSGSAVAVDSAGAAHVAGVANSLTVPPATACADRLVLSSGDPEEDAYVVKANATGSGLESCALLGGDDIERPAGLALDPFGGVYVTGYSYSPNFPTTEGAFQRVAYNDVFVFKLGNLAAGPPRMQFAAGAYRALEGDGQAVVTVTRRGDLAEASSVYYRTSPGTATAGEDYQHREGRLTFGEGESALAFTVPVVGDSTADKDETVNLTLSDPLDGELGFPAQAVLTIGEDDGLTRMMTISERGSATGPPDWRIRHDMSWLSFSATQGDGGAKITVTANPSGLAPGIYTGTVIVEADAEDSPQFVLVTLTVTGGPGRF